MQFVKRLKNTDGVNADSTQSMFSSTILEKIKEKGMTFFQGSAAVLQKMANYEEARVKLANTQLKKIESATKNETGAKLIITKKNLQYEELPHELFLTTRQKPKIRDVLAKRLSKAQEGYLGKTLVH